jgi:hypothetical protein
VADTNTWQPRDAEVARVLDRVRALEHRVMQWEQEVAGRWAKQDAARAESRQRWWQLALAGVTGVVLPLLVIGILAALHASGQ